MDRGVLTRSPDLSEVVTQRSPSAFPPLSLLLRGRAGRGRAPVPALPSTRYPSSYIGAVATFDVPLRKKLARQGSVSYWLD